ncbi:hypothetical protein HZI73_18135 [Vallitalea pronyensis]|uniref:Mor transcription activator domain-containing protein n=1 Tax=Vallitalea pronyensis TaxID=1348613 RepID=A0A8J8MMB0_9FIRM|nr:CD3324 family protein [Vallitalea pronyensis]QUI24094.1 hypothetical protein HZI73_18135 [Vallitalea pronyensis]
MSHKNGKDIFPPELLREIQKYINGGNVYIPRKDSHTRWGVKSGIRQELIQRNRQIRHLFRDGTSIEELSFVFGLSVYTIKKIVYGKDRGEKNE